MEEQPQPNQAPTNMDFEELLKRKYLKHFGNSITMELIRAWYENNHESLKKIKTIVVHTGYVLIYVTLIAVMIMTVVINHNVDVSRRRVMMRVGHVAKMFRHNQYMIDNFINKNMVRFLVFLVVVFISSRGYYRGRRGSPGPLYALCA